MENELPTRVIDVGDANTSPRLYEPLPGTKATYAALSYCWGSGRTFLTTQATYDRLKSGFTLAEMPKTCRDAVLIARSLGIPYIWIDQLCIIQDSSEDWNREAQRMCAVYENASVTFAGLDSPSSDIGLFLASPNRRTVTLDVNLPDGRTSAIYVRKEYETGSLGFVHSALKSPEDTKSSVLVTRGWTLQEVTLSPRILWFTASEMAWSCLSHTGCECDPVLTTWMQIWKELVMEFSKRDLTKQQDRLPALAGLAAAFQRKVKDQYLAGLWRNELATQLIW
ncbi:HET-domain-containing protein, partial [Amniculicola lignicola CBS 123094]